MSPIHIFDRALVRQHRNRSAAHFSAHDTLHRETAELLLERLADVKRDFTNILVISDAALAKELACQKKDRLVVAMDLAEKRLRSDFEKPSPLGGRVGWGGKSDVTDDPPPAKTMDLFRKSEFSLPSPKGGGIFMSVAADEEFLPFAEASFDLVVGNLSLQWVNDVPGALAQIKRALRPDGLFLAAFPGGQSLHELRVSLMEAELASAKGASPRLSPSIDLQTASALLQRAGFQLPVTDQALIGLTYSDIYALMRDLRGMGEANAHMQRSRIPARRELFNLADQIYKQRFARPDGRLMASFEVIFWHGWA